MNITKVVDHNIYPRKAISEAREAYKDYCKVQVTPMSDNCAKLLISVVPAHEKEGRKVVLSFLNYALDKAAEINLQDA